MNLAVAILFCLFCPILFDRTAGEDAEPLVTLSLLVRNKAHALKHVLGHVEQLNYPKRSISLFIRSEANEDDSWSLLVQWLDHWAAFYHSVDFQSTSLPNEDQCTPVDSDFYPKWTLQRQLHVGWLLGQAWRYALQTRSQFWFNMDADVVLTNRQTLHLLVSAMTSQPQAMLIAPMLDCPSRDNFANFWPLSSPDEVSVLSNRSRQGLFRVNLVHTAFLLRLDRMAPENVTQFERYLTTGVNRTADPRFVPVAALNKFVRAVTGQIWLDNRHFFGYFPTPIAATSSLSFEQDVYKHLQLQVLARQLSQWIVAERNHLNKSQLTMPFQGSRVLGEDDEKLATRHGLDKIYVINLARRVERQAYMNLAFQILGMEGELVQAVPGEVLSPTVLSLLRVRQLANYTDPVFNRSMTAGEVACFLSHYHVWRDMLDRGYRRVMVLEDDTRFSVYFPGSVRLVQRDADYLLGEDGWDFMYLGRKLMYAENATEEALEGSELLVWPEYSYWTIGYILTARGARKLIEAEPLKHMLPVDEYLPVMFNKHPHQNWMAEFQGHRDLVALATEPRLIQPLFFKGQSDYQSDTENSFLAF